MYFLATVNAKWLDIVNTFTITIQNNLTDIIFATAPCKMSQLTCNHCYYNVGTCICSVLLLDHLCTYLSLWYSDVVSVLMWFPERQVWRSRIDLDVCDDKSSVYILYFVLIITGRYPIKYYWSLQCYIYNTMCNISQTYTTNVLSLSYMVQCKMCMVKFQVLFSLLF